VFETAKDADSSSNPAPSETKVVEP
jgi:hypothetical protein